MDLKQIIVKVTCVLLWNDQISCLLNRNDPHVCEILVSGGDYQSESYKVECCLNYFEENDKCKPCRPGHFGRQCSETCLNGYFGSQCVGLCNCTKYEHCDPVKGCKCIDFTGNNCNFRCPEGTFGENCGNVCQCLRGISCDSVTGSCLCPAGFTGPSCTRKCSVDFFGENCSFNCSCPTNSVCDSVNGNCSCSPGFMGESCAEPCSNDFYGVNCSNKCHCTTGLVCHPVLGKCQCRNGTNDCKKYFTKQNHNGRRSLTLIIAMSCVGGSLFFVGIIIVIVFLLKRKHVNERINPQARRPLPEISHYDEINPYDEISMDSMPISADISSIAPYYSYPREHIRRFSLPGTNRRVSNLTQNGESRGYISLPNLSHDGTYLSPCYSMQSDLINLTNNGAEQPLRRENSGYLHPYNALRRPFDRHEYTKCESDTTPYDDGFAF